MIRKIFLLLPLFLGIWFAGCAGKDEAAYFLAEKVAVSTLPATDMQLQKRGFVIGYSEKYRQALWVEYVLSGESLAGEKVIRDNVFRTDPEVRNDPVTPDEYFRSGYDRGHLAPAADMSYSHGSMHDSFFMSNISPQVPGCNRGIWLKVEKLVRSWAEKEGMLMVITGPVFPEKEPRRMGRKALPVPEAFYKVVLDLTPPVKMIALIVPNQDVGRRQAADFFCTVDEVEKRSGLDFFSSLDDDEEKRLESSADFGAW